MAGKRIRRKGDSFIRDALILCVIAGVLTLFIYLVYNMTKNPIDYAAQEGRKAAYRNVFSGQGDIHIQDDSKLTADIREFMSEEENNQDNNARIIEGVIVTDDSGETIGRAFIAKAKGYGGDVTISVGIDNEGVVTGIDIVSMNETAGTGANCTAEEFKSQYIGKSGHINVIKKGTAAEDEINALSSATVTSEAVTDAVNICLSFAGGDVNTESK